MEIEIGQRYQHYKGNLYEIITVGRLTESDPLQTCVVYKALYEDPDFGYGAIWIRPIAMFKETIEFNGSIVPRFKKIDF